MRLVRAVVLVLLGGVEAWGQAGAAGSLSERIQAIGAAAHGRVAVACVVPGMRLDCAVDAEARPPMQSVFKLPLGMLVLHEVEQGRLRLDQPVRFERSDRILPKAYSPLWDRYPEAGVEVPLGELLRLTVALSDNVAADILLRTVGGPEAVDAYVRGLGVRGYRQRHSEKELHADERLQYEDTFSPAGAVELLRVMVDRPPLLAEHMALLLGWMVPEARGRRLEGELPEGVRVAHKSGTSDEVGGVAAATNDIGLVRLPDGRWLAIAVFVTDARAGMAERERVIAAVGRAVYEAAVQGGRRRAKRFLRRG